ncbi:MAG: hypothetical protein PHX27_04610 [Candidatus ainarchaeum sp.]|nr:hypothetical protein [Candidatus ainarchaeum sp.]
MNYNNGLPQIVDLEHKKEMAVDFSEGNKMLEKLLLTTWKKGIQTHACCNGHIDHFSPPERPYISFVYDNQDFIIVFAEYLSKIFVDDKNIQIELIKRNLDKLLLTGKLENENIQNSVIIRLNTFDEGEKSYYYNKICDLIKHINMSAIVKNYDEKYMQINKRVSQSIQDYNWQSFDDSYYLSIVFKPYLLLKNQYCVTKFFNNNIHYYNFYTTEFIQKPIEMDNRTAIEFLSTQKNINIKSIERNL